MNMIARGNHRGIMDYIQQGTGFDLEAQLALVARGVHDEIMAYVKKHHFFDKAEVALAERGNYHEIMAYVKANCSFCREAEPALSKNRCLEEVLRAEASCFDDGEDDLFGDPFAEWEEEEGRQFFDRNDYWDDFYWDDF